MRVSAPVRNSLVFVAVILLASGCGSAGVSLPQINLAGSWNGTWTQVGGTGGTVTATITQPPGQSFSGTATVPNNLCFTVQGAVSGTVVGTTVKFTVTSGTTKLTFVGTVTTNGRIISGTYVLTGSVVACTGSGTLTLNKL
jgi:hypothetical protein